MTSDNDLRAAIKVLHAVKPDAENFEECQRAANWISAWLVVRENHRQNKRLKRWAKGGKPRPRNRAEYERMTK